MRQLKVMGAIEGCRTAALGGHVARCENTTAGTPPSPTTAALWADPVMGSWRAGIDIFR